MTCGGGNSFRGFLPKGTILPIFAIIVGYIGDKIRQSGRVRVNIIRKVANSIGK